MNSEPIVNDLEQDLSELIEKEFGKNPGILGISISTHGGTHLASMFKKQKNPKMSRTEMSAASSSLVFLSSKILQDSLNQKIAYNLITGEDRIILSILTDDIALISYLNRQLAELEGLDFYIKTLRAFAIQISAIIETSDLIKEEIFVAIKRAIPNALVIAIITKDGLPIKVQSTMPEPILSAMTSAIFNLAGILLEQDLEYSIIGGENGSIILHELDQNRLLAIAVPEADEKKLGTYLVRIKTIIKQGV
jgi:predicted regulator of Ras-like GTPase activity (Roadblock/LC7/MglB family)